MSLLLSDTLVVCDMDNTLLTAKEGLPACNRTVIQLFTEMGGLFTVATGRPPESIRAALPGITLSKRYAPVSSVTVSRVLPASVPATMVSVTRTPGTPESDVCLRPSSS